MMAEGIKASTAAKIVPITAAFTALRKFFTYRMSLILLK